MYRLLEAPTHLIKSSETAISKNSTKQKIARKMNGTFENPSKNRWRFETK
jgi:hypothetical protein